MPHGPVEVSLHNRVWQHGQGSQLADLHEGRDSGVCICVASLLWKAQRRSGFRPAVLTEAMAADDVLSLSRYSCVCTSRSISCVASFDSASCMRAIKWIVSFFLRQHTGICQHNCIIHAPKRIAHLISTEEPISLQRCHDLPKFPGVERMQTLNLHMRAAC